MINYYDWIEDYINGELSQENMNLFKLQLQADEELSKKVNASIELKKNLELLRLKRKVGAILVKNHAGSKRKKLQWITIAASVALIFTVIFMYRIYHVPRITDQPDEIANESIKSDQHDVGKPGMMSNDSIHIIQKSSGFTEKNRHQNRIASKLAMINFSFMRDLDHESNDEQEAIDKIQIFMEKADFKSAYTIIDSLAPELYQDEITFLKAFCSFKLNDYNTAKKLFLVLSNSPQYAYESQWNYLLSLVMLSKIKEAGKLLDNILIDPNHPYYEEGRQLKKELQS